MDNAPRQSVNVIDAHWLFIIYEKHSQSKLYYFTITPPHKTILVFYYFIRFYRHSAFVMATISKMIIRCLTCVRSFT